MVVLPAFCDYCGAVFSSGFGGGGGATMIIDDCKSGPCPECGDMGTVPDGKYSLEDALIRFLSGPSSSIEKLNSIADRIQEMQKQGREPEAILDEVSKLSPGLANFANFFSKPLTVAYLGLIVSIASAISSHTSRQDSEEVVRDGVIGAFQHFMQELSPEPPILDGREKLPAKSMDNNEGSSGHDVSGSQEKQNNDTNGYNLNDYI